MRCLRPRSLRRLASATVHHRRQGGEGDQPFAFRFAGRGDVGLGHVVRGHRHRPLDQRLKGQGGIAQRVPHEAEQPRLEPGVGAMRHVVYTISPFSISVLRWTSNAPASSSARKSSTRSSTRRGTRVSDAISVMACFLPPARGPRQRRRHPRRRASTSETAAAMLSSIPSSLVSSRPASALLTSGAVSRPQSRASRARMSASTVA